MYKIGKKLGTYYSMANKIGFACKYLDPDQTQKKKLLEEIQRPLNCKATTIKWLNEQTRDVAEQRMWDIMEHNIQACYNLVEYVGNLDERYRMVRIGSDVLPAYTHADWSYFWRTSDARQYCESKLARVGELAKTRGVRLSMHPGQFTVLASDNPDIVERSIDEFEYHVDLARWMGYGQEFQDFKINVHISGKQGPDGIKRVLPRLSTEARNTITIENDENSWGIDASLELADHLALVLDIHHHFVREGEYINANDDRFKRVIDSWRGVTPVIHYSQSRENILEGHDPEVLPNMEKLLAQGYKKQKLRAHSDYMWNNAVNRWAQQFTEYADIMVEAKCKNLASLALGKFWEGLEDPVAPVFQPKANAPAYA